MTTLTFVKISQQKQVNHGIISHIIPHDPENTVMSIPDWMDDYRPVDNVDQRLFNLFRQLYQYPHGSKEQKKVISQIYNILICQKLINEQSIYKRMKSLSKGCDFPFSQDNYNDALSHRSIWLSEIINENGIDAPRICFFDLSKNKAKSLTKGLINWITPYIAGKLFDIHRKEVKQINKTDSLDIAQFEDDTSGETKLDHIPAGFQNLSNAPTLDELLNGNLLNELSNSDQQQVLNDIKEYLQTDPYGFLVSRHLPNYPECNYKILAERVILKEPRDTIRSIAHDFNIPREQEQGIYSHLTRTFYPIISSISVELGYYPEGFKDAIIEDIDGSLRSCNKIIRGKIVYDAQILAKKLLPLFQLPNFVFTTVVNYLNTQGDKLGYAIEHELTTSVIPIYHEQYFAVYATIAEELRQQGLRNITSFDVLTYWETVTIETFVTELHNQGYTTTTSQQIKTFWDEKARVSLGKLAISLR